MAVRIEDAGFEIRDMIAWVYGSGFPKSLDVSKAIDKAAGAERTEVVGVRHRNAKPFDDTAGWNPNSTTGDHAYTAPATEAARQWAGWGTALKPALEPITVARKPLIGTVAENVLAHGTGALNVDGCRVEGRERIDYGLTNSTRSAGNTYGKPSASADFDANQGRWPANLIHDGSDEVVGLFPQSKSTGGQASLGAFRNGDVYGKGRDERETRDPGYGDSGSAARFFYCAKASKRDRDEGCEGMEARTTKAFEGGQIASAKTPEAMGGERTTRNHHPTVKPTDLMRYLCRLVTPPGGTVLDPFMGSGSTGKAAMLEGFDFIGIERDPEYVKIAEARIGAAKDRAGLFG
jgi:site-specific DNA-methyltransferase (adenine-specific)